jgi:hypothetical protein
MTKVDAADRLVPVLRDPALKGSCKNGQAGPHGGQQHGGQRRVFDRGPPDRRGAEGIEGEDEAADARGRLDRPDHAVEADQIGEQGPRDPGDLGDQGARGVVGVDQVARVDLQRRRKCGLRLVDRQAAPPAVAREHAALLDRMRSGGLADEQLHGLEVGGRAPGLGPGVRLPGIDRRLAPRQQLRQAPQDGEAVAGDEVVERGIRRHRHPASPGLLQPTAHARDLPLEALEGVLRDDHVSSSMAPAMNIFSMAASSPADTARGAGWPRAAISSATLRSLPASPLCRCRDWPSGS